MLRAELEKAITAEKLSSYAAGQQDLLKSFQDVLEQFGDVQWKTSEIISMINDIVLHVKEQ